MAVAVACNLLLVGTAAPAVADTVDDLDLGPAVIRTDEGPTGYSVTFRYDAPDDVESVGIWGEWQFSSPEAIVGTTSEGRMGWDWKPGDIVAPAGPGFFPSFPISDMTQGEDGVWTWTTPLPSGTFSYRFVHDCPGPTLDGCTRYVDPANPGWASELTPTGAQTVSQVYVPQHPDFPTYDNAYQAPTPPERTGTFEHREYVSPDSTNPPGTHHLVAYLPAGYDADRPVPYPTLYLSHGGGGNETHFFVQALANYIMENLVADGAAQPMVIVGTNFNGLAGEAGYAQDLKENVIPFIEQEYNVSTLAEDRAFGGQSLGGAQGLNLLYNHTPTFEYYGLWAAAAFPGLPNEAQVENMKGVRGGIHMGTGLQDYLGNIGPNSQARVQVLRDHGLDVVEHNVNGTHTWVAARPLLANFMRDVVFRTTETSVSLESRGKSRITHVSATVKPLGTSQADPTGFVEFRRGDDVIGVARVKADGTARLRPPYRASMEDVEAHYLGDELFNGSESGLDLAPDTERPTVSQVSPSTAGPFSQLQVQVDASDAAGLSKIVSKTGTFALTIN